MRPICVVCRRRAGNIVPMPLTGALVAVCDRCRGAKFLREMAKLVAHG